VTVNDDSGQIVGYIRFDAAGTSVAEVIREDERPRVEAIAAHLARARTPRPRPGCIDVPHTAAAADAARLAGDPADSRERRAVMAAKESLTPDGPDD
jgi:hypothetical protein